MGKCRALAKQNKLFIDVADHLVVCLSVHSRGETIGRAPSPPHLIQFDLCNTRRAFE